MLFVMRLVLNYPICLLEVRSNVVVALTVQGIGKKLDLLTSFIGPTIQLGMLEKLSGTT